MATGKSGTIGTWISYWASCRLTWSESYDVETNSSAVTFSLQFKGYYTGETFWVNGSLAAGGVTAFNYIGQCPVYFSSRDAWANSRPSSWTVTIPHDSDGTKTASVHLNVRLQSDSQGGRATPAFDHTASITLTPIPRASTVSCGAGVIGSAAAIQISKAASTYVHTLTFRPDGYGSDLAVFSGGVQQTKISASSVSWSLTQAQADILYGLMSAAGSSVGCTVKCAAYASASSSAVIGTTTTRMTWAANPADTPTGTLTLTVTNPKTALTGDANTVILGYSNVTASLAATAKNGASLSRLSITNNGTAASGSSSPLSRTFSAITSPEFAWTAKDSRGLTGSGARTLSSVAYAPPTVAVNPGQMAADTGNVTVTATGLCMAVNFGAASNTCSVTIQHRASGGSWVSHTATVTRSGNNYTASATITGLDPTQAYTVRVTVTDSLQSVTSTEKSLISTPVFEWYKDRFQFNVPVNLRGAAPAIYGGGVWAYQGELAAGRNIHVLYQSGLYVIPDEAAGSVRSTPTDDPAWLLIFGDGTNGTQMLVFVPFPSNRTPTTLYVEFHRNGTWSAWKRLELT